MAELKAIRGMHDILMHETPNWQYLEAIVSNIINQYGYQEIRLPIVEKTNLFTQSIGKQTDIISKEMYSFEDRNKDSLTLRPEGTSSCVRAGIEHGLFYNQTQRLWYNGPMFRHERPQKGRQRQFHQIGIEAYGFSDPDIDAEHILICSRIWKKLNIEKDIKLEINSLGTQAARINYRKKLVEYFSSHTNKLDEDSLVRLKKNPLRILDSKNPDIQNLINNAPAFSDYLDNESIEHFNAFRSMLDAANIDYTINQRLVRGLDYYSKTVFEWVSNKLGAQGTVCAGGRYDDLIEIHGAKKTPAVGFAIGVERLLELVDFSNIEQKNTPHIYIVLIGNKAILKHHALLLAEELRNINDLRVIANYNAGSPKSQFKKADKSGAKLALILGEEELKQNEVTLKFLRNDKKQLTITRQELSSFIEKNI